MARTHLSVLVVDDEVSLRVISRRYLEESGKFLVYTAESAREALELMESPECQVDVIVSDYYLPGLNGMDFLKRVRSAYGNIPFIFFTGREDEKVIRDALEAGADCVLVKGQDLKTQWIEITRMITEITQKRGISGSFPDLLTPNLNESPGEESKPGIDQSKILTYLSEFGYELATLRPGANIHHVLSKGLISITGAIGEVFLTYHPATQSLSITDLSLQPGIEAQITRILGKNPRDLQITISTKRYQEIVNRIVERRSSLSEISGGQISPFVSSAIRKAGGYNHYLTIAYVAGGELLGISLIAMGSHEDPPEDMMRTISSLVALSLQGHRTEERRGVFTRRQPDLLSPAKGSAQAATGWETIDLYGEEHDLLREKKRLEQITNNMADMTALCDIEGWYLFVSPSFERILGYQSDELIGRHSYDFIHPENLDRVISAITMMLKGEIPLVRYQLLHKKGQYRWVESAGRLLHDTEGNTTGCILNTRDVTERVSIEEAFIRSKEKLNILSSITRHDILNQLQALESFCNLVELRVKHDVPATEYLDYMRQSCEKIHQQISFARDYQELGDTEPIWQNIEKIARIASMDALPDTVRFDVTTGGVEFFADPMLMLVFYNLFDNVKRHGDHVTTVMVSFAESESKGVVTIADDGPGVADDQKEDIFEKGVGANTGLGLFLAREILAITGILIAETGIFKQGALFTLTAPPHIWRRK